MKQFFVGRRVRTCLAILITGSGLLGFSGAQALTFSTLMFFNGVAPGDHLTLASDGLLYGPAVTAGGGAPGGLIYRVATDGTRVDTVYQYGSHGVFSGNAPHAALLQLSDGFLYGTTSFRSAVALTNASIGTGTVFKISTDGQTYTKLHDFADGTAANANLELINPDGALPQAAMILGTDGFLYGTTVYGGASGTGTIFKIRPDGSGFQSIYAFDDVLTKASTDANGAPITVADTNPDSRVKNTNGAHPLSRLVQAADGYLYGTTSNGGVNGTGTIFKIGADGSGFTLLKTFDASPDIITDTTDPNYGLPRTNTSGAYPASGLLIVNNVLYGVANSLSANGAGNVYSVATDGSNFTILHSFLAGSAASAGDGASPSGDLILGQDGMLTGTSSGTFNVTATTTVAATTATGAIFELSLDGATFSNLFVFPSDATNAYNFGLAPTSGVIQGSDGSYYGVTSQGGPYSIGTVFKFGAATTITTVIGTPPPYDGGGAVNLALILALMSLLGALHWQRRRAIKVS